MKFGQSLLPVKKVVLSFDNTRKIEICFITFSYKHLTCLVFSIGQHKLYTHFHWSHLFFYLRILRFIDRHKQFILCMFSIPKLLCELLTMFRISNGFIGVHCAVEIQIQWVYYITIMLISIENVNLNGFPFQYSSFNYFDGRFTDIERRVIQCFVFIRYQYQIQFNTNTLKFE